MVLQNFLPQTATVDVRIDFGRTDVLMAQHTLNSPQVGPSLQQVRGKRMAERMRTDGLRQSDLGGQFLDDMEHHDA